MSEVIATLVAAVSTACLAAAGPAAIRRLPEPDEEPEDEGPESDRADPAVVAHPPEQSDPLVAAALEPAKVPYAELAARPHLAWKLAAVGAAVGALVGWQLGWEPVLVAWVVLGGVGVVLGYVDAQTRLLPTRIIAPTYAVLVTALVVAALLSDEPRDQLVQTALGWATYGGFYVLLWLVHPRGLGYGDVRLSGLLGLALGYLGWAELLVGLYAGFLLGAVGGGLLAVLRIVDRRRYPFGPFMLLGALAGLLWGDWFADWYMSW